MPPKVAVASKQANSVLAVPDFSIYSEERKKVKPAEKARKIRKSKLKASP